jgi:predicted MPP superfamily phosphohydrolase
MGASFAAASVFGLVLVVLVAALVRGRPYAIFAGVILGVHTLIAVEQAPRFVWAWPLYAYLQATVYVHFLSLVRPRLRPSWYRLAVSIPASFFAAGTLLGFPWAILSALGFHPWAPWLPYAVALAGVVDSLFVRDEEVDLVLDGAAMDGLRRAPRGNGRSARPLRIVQITDPHLGPFMPVARLRAICERAVAKQPDLVLLTGDFLTMESQESASYLAEALSPLRSLPGRVFACRGNHDLEAPAVVAEACARAGVRLLIDEATVVDTGAGKVELVGFDFRFRGRAEHITRICAEHPRREGELRIALLHDPGAFKHVPEGSADLVLSGHTHGGQLGLLWLGLEATVVSALTSLPDHGFWGLGKNRLYVHRGTGHYGFPLRVGVPAEQSVLAVHALAAPLAQGCRPA